LATTTVLVTVYYLLPLDNSSRWLAVTMLAIGLVALTGLVTVQIRSIAAPPCPGETAIFRARAIGPQGVRQFVTAAATGSGDLGWVPA
jgi:hypothetical protein